MKIATDTLAHFVDVPSKPEDVRHLLDDLGIEVKRFAVDNGVGAMTLELLANRGDHYAYSGLAREISGRTGAPVTLPAHRELTVGDSPWPLDLQTELCPLYSITLLERPAGASGDLDANTLRRLEAADLHSIGPVVDATNAVNLEIGQPTHAFDAATVKGAITIRLSRAGEECWPLFQEKKIELPEGLMVIADDEKILAVAGVIGCEESKTTDATTRVLLESAAFDPVTVRKASQALGIHTDSSARFERGSDFTLPVVGAGRVAELLASAGWNVVGETGVVGDWVDPERRIVVRRDHLNRFLETELSTADLADRFTRYGFVCEIKGENLDVRVPAHRLWDVEFEADLIEEIAKSVGYNDTPISLPNVDMGSLPSHSENVKETVEEVLVGHGFYEVITDGFYGRSVRDQLGLTEGHPLWEHVETLNALDRAYSFLKNNALAQAVDGVSANLRVHNPNVKSFEWTRTFHPNPEAANEVCDERPILWGATCGPERPANWTGTSRPTDAIFLRGLVGEIARALDVHLTVTTPDPDYPLSSCLHPNRQAAIRLAGRTVGVLGEVHPDVLKNTKIKRVRPCYFEIECSALEAAGERPTYQEPPSLHPVERSLAFTLPHRVEAGSVAAVLRDNGPDWLTRVAIVDLFEHEADGAPVRTVTYALSYSNEAANRTNDEVNEATESLVSAVARELGDRGVTRRE